MSDFDRVRRDWERWVQQDPLFAVYTKPGTESGGWDVAEFLASGQVIVDELVGQLTAAGVELPVGSALDFGCGVGCDVCPHAPFRRCPRRRQLEPMVAEARELATRLDRQPTFHLNHEPNLRLFDYGRFAFVLSIVVLQHMPQEIALGYVREFLRVLRPGGIAVFQIPEAHGTPERLLDERPAVACDAQPADAVRARVLRKPTMELHPHPGGRHARRGRARRGAGPHGGTGRLRGSPVPQPHVRGREAPGAGAVSAVADRGVRGVLEVVPG